METDLLRPTWWISRTEMISKEIRVWDKGTINVIDPDSIKPGAISDSLNFLTKGDKMELRRGSRILGTDQGAGSIAGIGVATKLDASGTQVMFRKRKAKIGRA